MSDEPRLFGPAVSVECWCNYPECRKEHLEQSIAKQLAADYPYVWRVRSRLPARKGERCRVLVRGAMNSCLVQFMDGYQVVTSRNYLRRAPG